MATSPRGLGDPVTLLDVLLLLPSPVDALRIARVPVTSWDMLSVPAASYIAAACLLSVSLVEGVGGALPSAQPAAARVPAARATPWPAALLGPAMLIADARRRDSLCVFTLALATVRRIMRHADTNCDGRYTIKKFTRVFFGMTGEEYALLNAKGIEALFADCK